MSPSDNVKFQAVVAKNLIRFPDAPLHVCGENSYCDKEGQPHTERQFKDFEIWQNTLVWVWPIGLFALYILNRDRIRLRGWKQRE